MTLKNTPYLVVLHGLNSTCNSFNYILSELEHPSDRILKINYASHQSLIKSVFAITAQLSYTEDIILIGHSLGGVLAMILAHAGSHRVKKVITISSPLGGSKAAIFAQWIMKDVDVLRDITPYSPLIKLIEHTQAPCPVLSIISTSGGLHGAKEPNDSIVTVASQKALLYAKHVQIEANHFEILLMNETVQAVRDFIET